MSTIAPSAALLTVSREEGAFRSLAFATEKLARADQVLIAAFKAYDKAKDDLVEARIADVKVYMSKPLESAYATYRNAGKTAIERAESRS